MTDIEVKIAALGAYLDKRCPPPEGTWAIEVDEDGEIAVMRGRDGQPRAWMNADDYRALRDADERKETER